MYSQNNYEHYAPVYVKDVQEISDIDTALLVTNFPHHQIILCTAGEGSFCSELSEEKEFSCGDVLFAEAGLLFSVIPKSKNFSVKMIAFNGKYVSNYVEYFKMDGTESIKMSDTKLFDGLLKCKNQKESSLELYGILTRLGMRVLDTKNRENSVDIQKKENPLNKAKKLVFKSTASDEMIAEFCGFSGVDEMNTEFKRTVNMTPSEYRDYTWGRKRIIFQNV